MKPYFRGCKAFTKRRMSFMFIGFCCFAVSTQAQFPLSDTLRASGFSRKADSLQRAASYDSSNHFLNKAIPVYEKAEAWDRLFDCLVNLSSNYIKVSEYEKAGSAINRGKEIAEQHLSDDPSSLAEIYGLQGRIYDGQDNYPIALDWYNTAFNLIPDNNRNYLELRATIIFYMGDTYSNQGKYDQAIDLYFQALDLYNRSSNPETLLTGRIYNNIGIAYQNKGDNGLALDYYYKSLNVDKKELGPEHPAIAAGYNNIAIIYYHQGDYQQALDYFVNSTQTMSSYWGEQHASVAAGYNNIGIAYSEMGEPEEAIRYLKKSIAIKKNIFEEVHTDIAIGYQNLGALNSDLKKYDQAIPYYQKALALYLQIFNGPHPEIANVYSNLGDAYINKNDFEKALVYLHKDLDINKELFGAQHPFVGDAYNNIGWTYARQNDFVTALQYYHKAIRVLAGNYPEGTDISSLEINRVSHPVLLLGALENKGQAHRSFYQESKEPGQLQQALDTYLKASALIEQMQLDYRSDKSKLLLAQHAFDIYGAGIQTAYVLFEATNNSTYKQYALYFAEKSKAGVLLEQLTEMNAKSFAGIPDSLISYEDHMRKKLTRLNRSLQEKTDNTTHIGSLNHFALRDSIFVVKQQLASHIRYLEQHYPKYYQLKYKQVSVDPAFIQNELLDRGQTLIEYFYGKKSLFAFVITPQHINLHKIEIDSTLASDLLTLKKAIAGRQKEKFCSVSYAVYKQVFDPVRPSIHGNRLIIIPDGMLNYVPFEALLTQPNTNDAITDYRDFPYLIRDFEISYAPSARFLTFWKQHFGQASRKTDTRFLGFAPVFPGFGSTAEEKINARFTRRASPLPLSQYEVEQAAALFNSKKSVFDTGDPAKIFVRSQASESAFKKLSLERFNIIHLATHAFVTGDSVTHPGIRFAFDSNGREDGVLHINEIYNLTLSANLVVLSACETGIGELIKGEGMLSLARAFQYAGSENLLVSLWKVEDRSTSQLMLSFYRNRLNGDALAPALRKAKLELLKHPRYATPRYWAPFVLIGK